MIIVNLIKAGLEADLPVRLSRIAPSLPCQGWTVAVTLLRHGLRRIELLPRMQLRQNRQDLDEHLVAENFEGDDADRDHQLGQGREVMPPLAGVEADQVDVEAVQRAAEHDQRRRDEQPADRFALLAAEQQQRTAGHQAELQQEEAGIEVEARAPRPTARARPDRRRPR